MKQLIRIGTRESQLAVWQATLVKNLLQDKGFSSELVFIKSDADIDLETPLYAMGVQGVFTRSLDSALLNNGIDIAVHSMKDVPVQLAKGTAQGAVLKRASYKDLFVTHHSLSLQTFDEKGLELLFAGNPLLNTIATSSIRRKAQWLNKFSWHNIENIRGNVNTRLQKLSTSNWAGAIFAAAGLERIELRPTNSIELNWMLPAPAQGAILLLAREDDVNCLQACSLLNDETTALCTKVERDFLSALLGGCSTPISALATIQNEEVHIRGNVVSPDGMQKFEVEKTVNRIHANDLGTLAATDLLNNGANALVEKIRHAKN